MTTPGHYRRGQHVVSALHLHLVFVTKHRPGALTDDMLRSCDQVMHKVCADFGAKLREFNGDHDHVHLLVFYPPKVAVSALVNSLKGISAPRLRSEFTSQVNQASTRGHFWSPSYLAASCGGPPPGTIRHYIEQQQQSD